MKKILAIVLALVMVCTMAFAATTTETLKKENYGFMNPANTELTAAVTDITVTTVDPVVVISGGVTTTTYTAKSYVVNGITYILADATDYTDKLVAMKDGVATSVVALVKPVATVPSASLTVKNTITYKAGDVVKCGAADVTAEVAALTGTNTLTLYVLSDGNTYKAADPAVTYAYNNGKFVGIGAQVTATVQHAWDLNKTNVKDGVVTSVYCSVEKAYIPVVLDTTIAAASVDMYAPVAGLAGYSFLKAAAPAAATTTNPDTGANDVVGVAAALAAVAMVSAAAISLKK